LFSLISLDAAIKKINRLSSTIDLQAPWESKKAGYWDNITLQHWMEKRMRNRKARDLFGLIAEAVFAAHPEELSMLFALFYIRSGKDLDTQMNIRNGAQQDRILGGADLPARKIAEELSADIRLSHAVRKVETTSDGIQVTGEGFSLLSTRLIMAVPPIMNAEIRFNADLPSKKIELWKRMPMGSVWKCYAIYPTPFWRAKGLNGLAASDEGHTRIVFDNSPADGSKGILMGFVLAYKARDFNTLTEVQRKKSILDSFRKYFGDEASSPLMYIDHSWTEEPWSRGCYTGIMGPQTMTSFGQQLRMPAGNIHFAGTETSPVWNGYMEGAVLSGERVAREILETM
jgi:monoamine oxidase